MTAKNAVAALLVAFTLCACVSKGPAAPEAPLPLVQSAEECAALADMALVAGANARAGIAIETSVGTMRDIYAPYYQLRGAEAGVLTRAVVAAAYAHVEKMPKATPSDFASALAESCVMHRGDLAAAIGTEI